MEKRQRRKNVFLWTVATAAICMGAVKLMLDGPFDLSCKVHRYTGFSCSGCGATRMTKAMLHGQFYQAFRYNPFIFLSLPVMAILYMVIVVRYIRYASKNDWMVRVLFIYAIALCAFGVIRNIPGLEWLLPTTLN